MPPFRRNSSQSTSHLGLSAKDQKPQKTISELFATSKRPAAGLEDAVAGFAPICKRSKHLHPAPPDSPRPKALTPAEMYSFPPSPSSRTRSTNGIASSSEVIDLTGSPDTGSPAPSPKPRKPTGIIRASALKSQNGPRKLVVKNLKKAPQADPEKYYNQVWNQLDAALSAIFANEHIPYSFEELYKGVESLCRQDHAPALYKKLREKCKHNVSVRVLEPVLKSASIAQENARTLDVVVKAWSTWTDQMVCRTRSSKRLTNCRRLPFAKYSSTLTGHTSYSRKRWVQLKRWAFTYSVHKSTHMQSFTLKFCKEHTIC